MGAGKEQSTLFRGPRARRAAHPRQCGAWGTTGGESVGKRRKRRGAKAARLAVSTWCEGGRRIVGAVPRPRGGEAWGIVRSVGEHRPGRIPMLQVYAWHGARAPLLAGESVRPALLFAMVGRACRAFGHLAHTTRTRTSGAPSGGRARKWWQCCTCHVAVKATRLTNESGHLVVWVWAVSGNGSFVMCALTSPCEEREGRCFGVRCCADS